jgi:hypothetical protein
MLQGADFGPSRLENENFRDDDLLHGKHGVGIGQHKYCVFDIENTSVCRFTEFL